jgi:hypothetical protein
VLVTQPEVQQQPSAGWSVPAPAIALVMPEVGMERVARTGRVRWPLLITVVCSLLAAGAAIMRVDARDATLRELEQKNELLNSSDRQIEDATTSKERIFTVSRIAGALVEAPVKLLGYVILLYGLSWFLRGRVASRAVAAVGASALLPGAVARLLEAGATLQQPSMAPDAPAPLPRTLADLGALVAGHPLTGAAAKLLGALDLFSFWSALLLAFGFAAATQLPRRRAITATLVAWLCIQLISNVAMGGR